MKQKAELMFSVALFLHNFWLWLAMIMKMTQHWVTRYFWTINSTVHVMHIFSCFIKYFYCVYVQIETYWTYELCHGKYLRQYHEEKETGKVCIMMLPRITGQHYWRWKFVVYYMYMYTAVNCEQSVNMYLFQITLRFKHIFPHIWMYVLKLIIRTIIMQNDMYYEPVAFRDSTKIGGYLCFEGWLC